MYESVCLMCIFKVHYLCMRIGASPMLGVSLISVICPPNQNCCSFVHTSRCITFVQCITYMHEYVNKCISVTYICELCTLFLKLLYILNLYNLMIFIILFYYYLILIYLNYYININIQNLNLKIIFYKLIYFY